MMNSRRYLPLVVAALGLLGLASANAQNQTFSAFLSGPAESPPNASPGNGYTIVIINPITHFLHVEVTFANLTAGTTASHIHAATTVPGQGTAGVATQTPYFSGFPIGVTSGSYSNNFDMSLSSTWNSAYISANGGTPAGAEAAFVAAVQTGRAYLNIHTSNFPGGEIRGFLAPGLVPESGTTVGLMLIALTGLALTRYRVRQA